MTSAVKICPQCKKVSYVSNILQHTKCAHCGFLLSAWAEKRAHPRIAGRFEVTITAGNEVFKGQCVDHSYKGFRIEYNGTPFDKGMIFDIAAEDINARGKAELVWSSQYSIHTAHIGIKII